MPAPPKQMGAGVFFRYNIPKAAFSESRLAESQENTLFIQKIAPGKATIP
jgi:hypothetical protein